MNPLFVDHYSTLMVEPDADEAAVKSAYRKLARQYHPDRPGGDVLKFLEIQGAYSVLVHPDRRRDYDFLYERIVKRKEKPSEKPLLIPSTRIRFPGSMEKLARRGLLRKSFRNRDRRLYLRIDYDMELPLSEKEIHSPLRIQIPVPSRNLCPECRGSDPDCGACNGKGYRKSTAIVQLDLSGGLLFGQILEIDLNGHRPGPFSHYKKKKLKLLISRTV